MVRIMPSKVRVNMRACDRTTTITVTDAGNGTYTVQFNSACGNVKEFFRGLESIDIRDLSDKKNSRIFERMRESSMSANCLVPAGLLSAGWTEAGLLSKNLALSVREHNIEFLE